MIVVVKPKTTTVTVSPDNTEVLVNSPIKTLAGLTDVDIGSSSQLNEGDVLEYKNGKWTNSATGASSDSSYVHNQTTASSTWTINHNLSKYPSYVVVDSANDEVEGSVTYINTQQMVLNFSASFTGKVYLN